MPLGMIFYIFDLKKMVPSSPDLPWYDSVAVGKNKLMSMLRDISAEGGISKKTNHSLRATGATVLINAGVPEKIVQKYYWPPFSGVSAHI